ncbi:MAG TPA: radical SAM protein [Tenericutes bacterium]|nr:radical SAM protein [Mycoplasmatota bacterium]
MKKSLLPYIINELVDKGVDVGLTTSGLSAIYLEKYYKEEFLKLNDIDVSIDSPIESEHDENRGKNVFKIAIKALELCEKYKKDSTIVMCAMKWNFTKDRIKELVELSKKYGTNIRINILKPTDEKHLDMMPSISQIKEGFNYLVEICDTLDMSEPSLAGAFENKNVSGCSCGVKSLRINSITSDGKIAVSPCVYMHHFKVGNLLEDDILDIIKSPQFKEFENRKNNYKNILECKDCASIDICRGGCAASAYWYNYNKNKTKDMFCKDPYCIKEIGNDLNVVKYKKVKRLVHQDYLCTWIGKVKE